MSLGQGRQRALGSKKCIFLSTFRVENVHAEEVRCSNRAKMYQCPVIESPCPQKFNATLKRFWPQWALEMSTRLSGAGGVLLENDLRSRLHLLCNKSVATL